MKYLKIHVLLWYIFATLFMIIMDVIPYLICLVAYFLWCFKIIKWSDVHRCEERKISHRTDSDDAPMELVLEEAYQDNTPLDTMKRYRSQWF